MDLVKSNYCNYCSLHHFLFKISPELIPLLDDDFIDYLHSTVVANNFDDGFDTVFFNQTTTVPPLENQKFILNHFKNLSDKSSYRNLFNALVGSQVSQILNEKCSIFYVDQSYDCLFNVGGKQFWYQQKPKSPAKNSNNVSTAFDDIIQSLRPTNERSSYNDTFQDVVLEELEADNLNLKTFGMISINHRSMLYSPFSTGKLAAVGSYMLDTDSKYVINRAMEFILGNLKNKNHCMTVEKAKKAISKHILEIHKKFLRCNLDSLLKRYCPLPRGATSKKNFQMNEALNLHTQTKDFFRYFYAVYQTIFPVKVFGTKRNHRLFYANLKKIFSSSYISQFRIWDLATNLDLAQMRPILDKSDNQDCFVFQTNNILKIRFLYWIFEALKYLNSVKFYITESGYMKFALLFYRFDLWAKIRFHAVKKFLEDGSWKLRKPVSLKCDNMDDFLRHSTCRFIPKKKSIRPITSLKFYRSEKKLKESLQLVINLLRKLIKSPSEKFSQKWTLKSKIESIKRHNPNTSFFVVRGDFHDCYPSILCDKLIQILTERIEQLEKSIESGNASQSSLLEIELINSLQQKRPIFFAKMLNFVILPKRRQKTPSLFDMEKRKLIKVVRQQLPKMRRCVYSSAGRFTFNQNVAKKWIELYLKKNLIRMGRNTTLRLVRGIRQGGPLSNELCTIYLDHLWQSVFFNMTPTNPTTDFFVHVADDFLFVTTDVQKAKQFAIIVCEGFPEYNLRINPEKLMLNFDIESGVIDNKKTKITFCGRTIFPDNLSVGIDFSFLTGQRILNTFACNPFLPVRKVMKIMEVNVYLQVYPDMLDCRVTSNDLVARNLFERCLLQAFRFAGFLCESPRWRKCPNKLGVDICKFVRNISQRFNRLIKKWGEENEAKNNLQFSLTFPNVLFVCVSAFRLLWNRGPHKIRCRVGEAKCIEMFWKKLLDRKFNQLKDRKTIDLPQRLYAPFDQIKI